MWPDVFAGIKNQVFRFQSIMGYPTKTSLGFAISLIEESWVFYYLIFDQCWISQVLINDLFIKKFLRIQPCPQLWFWRHLPAQLNFRCKIWVKSIQSLVSQCPSLPSFSWMPSSFNESRIKSEDAQSFCFEHLLLKRLWASSIRLLFHHFLPDSPPANRICQTKAFWSCFSCRSSRILISWMKKYVCPYWMDEADQFKTEARALGTLKSSLRSSKHWLNVWFTFTSSSPSSSANASVIWSMARIASMRRLYPFSPAISASSVISNVLR